MEQDNKQFILGYIEDFSNNPITSEMLDKYIAESDIELKNHIIAFEKGMPNYRGDVHDIIAEGDKVVVRMTLKGVHKGELFGQPATNKTIASEIIIIYQVKNKKIIDHWMHSDSFAFMQKIGAIQPASLEEDKRLTRANNYSVLITNQDENN